MRRSRCHRGLRVRCAGSASVSAGLARLGVQSIRANGWSRPRKSLHSDLGLAAGAPTTVNTMTTPIGISCIALTDGCHLRWTPSKPTTSTPSGVVGIPITDQRPSLRSAIMVSATKHQRANAAAAAGFLTARPVCLTTSGLAFNGLPALWRTPPRTHPMIQDSGSSSRPMVGSAARRPSDLDHSTPLDRSCEGGVSDRPSPGTSTARYLHRDLRPGGAYPGYPSAMLASR